MKMQKVMKKNMNDQIFMKMLKIGVDTAVAADEDPDVHVGVHENEHDG